MYLGFPRDFPNTLSKVQMKEYVETLACLGCLEYFKPAALALVILMGPIYIFLNFIIFAIFFTFSRTVPGTFLPAWTVIPGTDLHLYICPSLRQPSITFLCYLAG